MVSNEGRLVTDFVFLFLRLNTGLNSQKFLYLLNYLVLFRLVLTNGTCSIFQINILNKLYIGIVNKYSKYGKLLAY